MSVDIRSTMEPYFNGKKLYGDDFTLSEIEEWFRDEEEGYSGLGAANRDKYEYSYHSLNKHHGFRFVKNRQLNHVLGYGSAYGDELFPVIQQVSKLTIVDSSSTFSHDEVFGKPVNYIKAQVSGQIDLPDASVDLITCFGVLHHIPNVSFILSEFHRILTKNGIIMIREPIVSMGDWTKPRPGLTKRERGIPYEIFIKMISDVKLNIDNSSLCMFSPWIQGYFRLLKSSPFNSFTGTYLDHLFSYLFSWNLHYYRKNIFQKFAPSSVFFVLSKQNE